MTKRLSRSRERSKEEYEPQPQSRKSVVRRSVIGGGEKRRPSAIELNKAKRASVLFHRSRRQEEEVNVEETLHREQEARWDGVFWRFQVDNEVFKNRLHAALQLLGHHKPSEKTINSILDGLTPYAALSRDEFFDFLTAFEDSALHEQQECFNKYDCNSDGYLDDEELVHLMMAFGFTPMENTITEIIREVDKQGNGQLCFSEFKVCIDLLRIREGFSKREVDFYRGIFDRFDSDGSGSMGTDELSGVMNWLHFSIPFEEVLQISEEVDIDGSGELSDEEFLALMRKVREREIAHIKRLIDDCDVDRSGTIEIEELTRIIRILGFYPEICCIDDAAEDAGVPEIVYGFEELMRFLDVFRDRDGRSRAEVKEIKDAFARCDPEGVGEITVIDAGKLLRYLGFPLAWDLQQVLIAQVDMDRSGSIDLVEFQKLVRLYREREVARIRSIFHSFANVRGKMDAPTVVKALHILSRPFELEGIEESMVQENNINVKTYLEKLQDYVDQHMPAGEDGLNDYATFVSGAEGLLDDLRSHRKRNAGFDEEQIMKMKFTFAKYDVDHSGRIQGEEQRLLLEDLLAERATSPSQRNMIIKMLHDSVSDMKKGIDFIEFCKLVRLVHEIWEQDHLQKEKKVIAATGYSLDEVNEFRSLFISARSEIIQERTKISFEHFYGLLHDILSLQTSERKELLTMFQHYTSDVKRGADFPEFLRLMCRIFEMNFAGIKKKLQTGVAKDRRVSTRSSTVFHKDAKPNIARRMTMAVKPSNTYDPGNGQLTQFGKQGKDINIRQSPEEAILEGEDAY
jgi:Ca2+-binding EF-hand superfamily protein